MARIILTKRQISFLRANRLKLQISELAEALDISRSALRRHMVSLGIALTKKECYKLQSQRLTNKTTSTPVIDRILKKKYLILPKRQLAELVGRSETFVVTRLRQLGLVIPKEIIEQRKADSLIKPGNIPANKGKKMPISVYKKVKRTMFKKGNLPHTTLYDGCITIRRGHRNRNAPPYKYIRLSKAKWIPLHVHIWQQKHGKVPKGHAVIFRNKDTMDCRLRNLKLVTRAELMKMNTIHNLPPDIKKTVIIIRSLNRKINKYEKQIS